MDIPTKLGTKWNFLVEKISKKFSPEHIQDLCLCLSEILSIDSNGEEGKTEVGKFLHLNDAQVFKLRKCLGHVYETKNVLENIIFAAKNTEDGHQKQKVLVLLAYICIYNTLPVFVLEPNIIDIMMDIILKSDRMIYDFHVEEIAKIEIIQHTKDIRTTTKINKISPSVTETETEAKSEKEKEKEKEYKKEKEIEEQEEKETDIQTKTKMETETEKDAKNRKSIIGEIITNLKATGIEINTPTSLDAKNQDGIPLVLVPGLFKEFETKKVKLKDSLDYYEVLPTSTYVPTLAKATNAKVNNSCQINPNLLRLEKRSHQFYYFLKLAAAQVIMGLASSAVGRRGLVNHNYIQKIMSVLISPYEVLLSIYYYNRLKTLHESALAKIKNKKITLEKYQKAIDSNYYRTEFLILEPIKFASVVYTTFVMLASHKPAIPSPRLDLHHYKENPILYFEIIKEREYENKLIKAFDCHKKCFHENKCMEKKQDQVEKKIQKNKVLSVIDSPEKIDKSAQEWMCDVFCIFLIKYKNGLTKSKEERQDEEKEKEKEKDEDEKKEKEKGKGKGKQEEEEEEQEQEQGPTTHKSKISIRNHHIHLKIGLFEACAQILIDKEFELLDNVGADLNDVMNTENETHRRWLVAQTERGLKEKNISLFFSSCVNFMKHCTFKVPELQKKIVEGSLGVLALRAISDPNCVFKASQIMSIKNMLLAANQENMIQSYSTQNYTCTQITANCCSNSACSRIIVGYIHSSFVHITCEQCQRPMYCSKTCSDLHRSIHILHCSKQPFPPVFKWKYGQPLIIDLSKLYTKAWYDYINKIFLRFKTQLF